MARSERKLNWTMANGTEIAVEIEKTSDLKDEIAYADGWNVNLGKKLSKTLLIRIILGGKVIERALTVPYTLTGKSKYEQEVIEKGAFAKVGNSLVSEGLYTLIMTTLAEMDTEIEAEKTEELKEFEAQGAAKVVAEEAKIEALTTVEIPVSAINAYNAYQGDAEQAWEDENEIAWAQINRWAPYIVAQHGMHPEAAKRMFAKMQREQSFGAID